MKIVPGRMKFAGALLFSGVVAPSIFCQEPPVASPNTDTEAPTHQDQKSGEEPKSEISVQDTTTAFKIRVHLVQVHVVVRDGAGKPVGGLRKDDFQLYDNNKLQAITTFGVEDSESRKEPREAAAKTQLDNRQPDAQVAEIVPERFVALTFDDVHLLNSDVPPMRAAANAFIDATFPGDRAGVFTTSGVVTQDFTGNKELLVQFDHREPCDIARWSRQRRFTSGTVA